MGVGFKRPYHSRTDMKFLQSNAYYPNPPYDRMVEGNHRFIRGNHDSPEVCRNHPNWIPDGQFENDMFFLGGAFSIDWQMRMPGVSWWEDEELSIVELNAMIDKFESLKPKIVVTHDCPTKFAMLLKSHHMDDKSRTRAALDTMLEIHKPDLWVFGHPYPSNISHTS